LIRLGSLHLQGAFFFSYLLEETTMKRFFLKAAAAGAGALLVSRAGFAQKKYDDGASDKEI
jgi:hypothetical protein